jgi:3-dehydroquinate dehydratase-1
MESHTFDSPDGAPRVVGSFGNRQDLRSATAEEVVASCDWVEIRLDRLAARAAGLDPADWRSLAGLPMLFTARRSDEGGEHSLAACERVAMLECALEAAAAIDVEVASIAEMGEILEHARQRGIPWVASFHDFDRLPESAVLERAVDEAVDAGAAVFKLAARLSGPADLVRLADFQEADHGIPKATMGMGPLGAVSRLLCAQAGSVLDYGFLGQTPTAPGQWHAALLKQCIAQLPDLRVSGEIQGPAQGGAHTDAPRA